MSRPYLGDHEPCLRGHPHQTMDPNTPAVLARYPLQALIQLLDGQHFMIVMKSDTCLILQPVSADLAERLCSSDDPTTSPLTTN